MYTGIFYQRSANRIHLWDDVLGHKSFEYKPYCYYQSNDDDAIFQSVYGDKLKKMTFTTPAELREFKDSWQDKVFESDLRPELRTLIDFYYKAKSSIPQVNVAFIDIEVDIADPKFMKIGGFPEAKDANAPINAITVYLTATKEYHTWVLLQPNMSIDISFDSTVHSFMDEGELLMDFMNNFAKFDLRVYSGWNSESFDVPYIFNRVVKVLGKNSVNHLSTIRLVKYNAEREDFQIAGTAHLDYMNLYKKFTANERDSYRLDVIAETELGSNKVKFDGALGSLYRRDIIKFIEYNIGDVKLLVDLDEKLKYIELARTMCYKGNIPFESIVYASLPIDGAILSHLKNQGLVAPDGKHQERQGHIQGAYVANPRAGLHEYMVDLDFTSLYPSIMRSLNISPETKVRKLVSNDVALLEGVAEDEVVSSNGCVYSTIHRGVIPTILDLWFSERVEFKAKMNELRTKAQDAAGAEHEQMLAEANHYDQLQYTAKISLNTIYGVCALPSFRFHDRDNAEAVTLTGQEAIKYAWKETDALLQKLGSKDRVVYADTDSLMFSCKSLLTAFGNDLDDIPDCVSVIRDKLMPAFAANNRKVMTQFAQDRLHINGEHFFHLKQEFIARRMFFLQAKKRYGLWKVNDSGIDCDEIEVKGLDIRRSSYAPYFKEAMKECCDGILKGMNPEQIQEQIRVQRRGVRKQPLEKIATPTGMKKLTPLGTKGQPVHVRASQVYNKMLEDTKRKDVYPIKAGAKIRWVYLTPSNPWNENVIAFDAETPKDILEQISLYVDYDTLIAKNIEAKLGPIVEICGVKMPERVNEQFEGFFSF